MPMFFLLFKIQNIPNYTTGFGLIFLRHLIQYFETNFEGVKYFDYRFYLVTPSTEETHKKFVIWNLIFSLFSLTSSISISSYTYKEEDLSLE